VSFDRFERVDGKRYVHMPLSERLYNWWVLTSRKLPRF
jgi:hypothetical protein